MIQHFQGMMRAGLIIGLAVATGTVTLAELVDSRKLVSPAPAEGQTLFRLLTPDESGVDMSHQLDLSHPLKRLYYGHACGGIAIGDVNGDALPDLYFVSGPASNRLFVQTNSPGTTPKFQEVPHAAGAHGSDAWGVGVAMVDIDGDRDNDLYVCNYDRPNQLFINEGSQDKPKFTEQAQAYGLDVVDASWMPAFADYDRDGDLDLYLLTYTYYREGGRPNFQLPTVQENGAIRLTEPWRKYYRLRPVKGKSPILEEISRPDRLLRNEGPERSGQIRFADVTTAAGIGSVRGAGNSVVWWDFDRDGHLDLYVANDLDDPDYLYRNLGNGRFQDVTATTLPHTSWFSMGSATADINNDGLLDLFVVDMAGTNHFRQKVTMGAMNAQTILKVAGPPPQVMRNAFYINSGTQRFLEGAYLTGLAATDWSWTPKFNDYDNDGRIDLFVTNGVVRDILNSDYPAPRGQQLFGKTIWDHFEDQPERPEQNLAFRNAHGFQFEETSQPWGLGHHGMSYSAASGDLDGDGDVDLVVANLNQPVHLYLNQESTRQRLAIQLRGKGKNTAALGALVEVRAGQQVQLRQQMPTQGYLSSDDTTLHFGMGAQTEAEVLIRWPDGSRETLTGLAAGHTHLIQQGKGQAAAPRSRTRPLFKEDFALKGAGGLEKAFDDFQIQSLLPNKLSNLGPGIALADIDGDGDDDLMASRPAGVRGALLTNTSRPRGKLSFEGFRSPAFDASDGMSEDMAPLFFDADGDDDLDLLIVSGSVEWRPQYTAYRDRLYLNVTRGQGRPLNFTKAPKGSLPDLRDSGSVAAACDFDRDGDLDLFVGSRVIPGQYPAAPQSRLLANQGNAKFLDATASLAPELLTSGLVTSAVWSDYDDDGWVDLLVSHEWGPIKAYRNHQGKLVDETVATGLHQWTGWWNGLAAGDVDNDGDMDYVATNLGLNSKYHATPEKPAVIFYGDVDGSGRPHIIEAEYEGNACYPVRGKSCSTRAMPSLGKKFTTFAAFARATVDEIYSEARLNQAQRFAATTLASGIFLNKGGKFQFKPFPQIAQIAPAFGVVLMDVDDDGWLDACLAQNFFSPQLETGRMDGGVSQVLRGLGGGQFTALSAQESGIVVEGDAKGLASADLNRDGWLDLLFGVNNGDPRVFLRQPATEGQPWALRLRGPKGNRQAIGAKVSLTLTDGSSRHAEIQAGGGYLSQSSATLRWHLSNRSAVSKVVVRWPDGQTSQHSPSENERRAHRMLVPHPSTQIQ